MSSICKLVALAAELPANRICSSFQSPSFAALLVQARFCAGQQRLLPLAPPVAPDSTDPTTDNEDDGSSPRSIYLVSISRVLHPAEAPAPGLPALADPSTWSWQQIKDAILDAALNPLTDPRSGGRPRQNAVEVKKMWVFRERHEDGTFHFHVALSLSENERFLPLKRSLRMRHGLATQLVRATVISTSQGVGEATGVKPGAGLTDTARRTYDMAPHKYLTKKEAHPILLTE